MRRDGALRYQQVWANLTARAPELQRVATGRRQSAEQLKADLLASPPKVWLARIRGEERFRNSDLFDLLVEECHGALPYEPQRAQDFSTVAVDLGRRDTRGNPLCTLPSPHGRGAGGERLRSVSGGFRTDFPNTL